MIEKDPKRRAMGDFLRKHRESFVVSLGDNTTSRRRTRGLRREEVAQLVGISAAWYTRLEQGKEVTPSTLVLTRIAVAFKLSEAERDYLFRLAGRVDLRLGTPPTNNQPVGPIFRNFISAISSPSYILDRYYSPIVWNEATEQIFGLWLTGPEKNLLRHVFLDPAAKDFLVDWELCARRLLAQFRIDYIKYMDEPQMVELVRGLQQESDFFRNLWNDHQVLQREGNERLYNHPQLGKLKYFQNTFSACSDPSLKLVILTQLMAS